MKIAINFCGGCNPSIERGPIAKDIKDALEEKGNDISFNDYDADYIVFLSGCSVGCAEHGNKDGKPGVTIAGEIFDHRTVKEDDIARRTIMAVLDRANQNGSQ